MGNLQDNSITGNSAGNILSDGGTVTHGSYTSGVLTGLDNGGTSDLIQGGGNDTMAGGLGNDIYIVTSSTDVISESSGQGLDLVKSFVDFNLGTNGANVESLVLMGTADLNATGSTSANTLVGNGGNNILDDGGVGGNDTMVGGAGDDTYMVSNASDVITEGGAAGTDLVEANLTVGTYALGANIEDLTLMGTNNINGTGNTAANLIIGNSGNNIINDGGAGGSDTLIGGGGNDTYLVHNTGDVISENAAEGTDLASSTVSYTLGANIENLTLSGNGALNGTGNTDANIIIGNVNTSGTDVLSDGGAGGNDTITGNSNGGAAGSDTFIVNNTGDSITETNAGTAALISSSVNFTLVANVETLTLTSGGNINGTANLTGQTLNGNSGNNVLADASGVGGDTMTGGTGNDTYVVTHSGDVITENAAEGTDLVSSSITYTLGANFENLTLITGAGSINGTGNALANVITGNDSKDILNGGVGADTMAGHSSAHNDTFMVDNVGDVATESASGGASLVDSSVSFTLSANILNLDLTNARRICLSRISWPISQSPGNCEAPPVRITRRPAIWLMPVSTSFARTSSNVSSILGWMMLVRNERGT